MTHFGRLIGLVPFLLAGATQAGPLAYTCTVTHVYTLTDSATIEVSGFEKEMKGSSFSVSRVTGEIIGEVVPTLLAKSTRVVNKGTKENSFKAVADFGEQFQLLEVQEFKPGAAKPFIASSMGGAGIVTGTCK
ncbi:MAG: hypothetical protein AABY61_12745 [Nitrospirota bacterium]